MSYWLSLPFRVLVLGICGPLLFLGLLVMLPLGWALGDTDTLLDAWSAFLDESWRALGR